MIKKNIKLTNKPKKKNKLINKSRFGCMSYSKWGLTILVTIV